MVKRLVVTWSFCERFIENFWNLLLSYYLTCPFFKTESSISFKNIHGSNPLKENMLPLDHEECPGLSILGSEQSKLFDIGFISHLTYILFNIHFFIKCIASNKKQSLHRVRVQSISSSWT